MKLKLKLDQKTILDFLLQNVEKIGLALFVAVFLLMLYSALKAVGHFDKTPELLQQTVTAGKAEIDKTPAETGLVVSDYVSQAKRSRVHIEEKPYSHLAAWVNPLFEPRLLRNAPPVFAVQQLQATTSAGAFRTTGGAAGGEGVSGRRWVVVTGLVPIEKQEAAYAETFKPSVLYEPQNDVPVYLGYWVERAEVSSAGDAANPNWEKAKTFISKEAIDTALKEWGVTSSGANDVVGMEYLDEALTFPLGPLVNRNWDKAVAHPEIPVKKLTEAAGGMGDMPPGAKPAGSTREAAADTPFGDSKSTGEMERAMPGEMAGPDQEKKVAQYKLFRFFDFSVEPNKQYVYRVCLALKNPNRDRKQGLLAQPDLATAKFLKTKWSDPSAAISVPGDTRVLAGAITPARGEPWCKIVVVKWLSANGIEAFVEKVKIVRGQVADFPGETFKPPALVHQNVAADFAPPEMMEAPGMPGPRVRSRRGEPEFAAPAATSSKSVDVDFITGVTVVDMRGGERIPGRRGTALSAVGELLLLNPDGTLTMRNELNDETAYQQLTNPQNETSAAEAGGPGPMVAPGLPPKSPLDEAIGWRSPAKKKTAKPK